ncbi:MAG: hypothetical protein C4325_05075 [Blastocatellia bacterium]
MPKKFDTNPLDPGFPAKVASDSIEPPNDLPFRTAEYPIETAPPSVTEVETRRFAEADVRAYGGLETATLHNPVTDPAGPAGFGPLNRASGRKVAKTGVPERWLVGLPYLPFSIGLVAGLIELLVIPKYETKVRFHAAQGLAAHVAILVITAILGGLGSFSGLASAGRSVFVLVTTIMLIVFAIKAWTGKPVHIESVDDLTNWLEEKISPRKA